MALIHMCRLLRCAAGAALLAAGASACANGAADPIGRLPQSEAGWAAQRERMVERQIAARGVRDPRVLDAMRTVPRHLFVPADAQPYAYEDRPLAIGLEQTISQPYIVAYMTEMLELSPDDRVLEIGTGSGYQAAVLAELAREVYTIEILPELGELARDTLERLGYTNVRVRIGDGWQGWPEEAPFTAIMVTAAPPEIPPALVDQLAAGGRLIVPVGTDLQYLTLVTRTDDGVTERRTIPVTFVPMTGRPGG